MAFDAPSELEFDRIDSVTLEDGEIASEKERDSGLSSKQKNRKTLLRVHEDIFEDFHHEIDFFSAIHPVSTRWQMSGGRS